MKRTVCLLLAASIAGCSARAARNGPSPAGPGPVAAEVAAGRTATPDVPTTGSSELTEEQRAALRVARLEVEVEPRSIRVGESARVFASAFDAEGAELTSFWGRLVVRGGAAAAEPDGQTVVGQSPGTAEVLLVVDHPATAGQEAGTVEGSTSLEVLPARITRIEIDLPTTTLLAGTRYSAGVRARTESGVRDDAEVAWRSSAESVLGVSSNGTLEARSPGHARLIAESEGVAAELEVTVRENPVRSLVVTPEEATARTGDVVHLSAEARNRSGELVPEAVMEWSVATLGPGDLGSALVDRDGTFVANDPGVYRVTATAGALSAVAEVQVAARPRRLAVRRIAHGVIGPEVGSTTDLWVFEGVDGRDYAYTGTLAAATMYVWDVTDPASPTITDSVIVDGRRANDVKLNADATLAIITSEGASNRQNGFTILDIADPAHPAVLTHFTDGLTGGVHNVWIDGETVYAVHDGTAALHVVDISDPARPRNIGRWQVERDGRYLHDVMVKDGLAYLSYWNDGLVILDVGAGIQGGTPSEPVFVSQYRYAYDLGGERYGNTHHAIRHENWVFLADEIFGCSECVNGPRGYVHVIDVADIERPVEVATYRVPEAGTHNLWAEGDRLYVAYYQGGLRVVDISGELRGDLYRQGREIAWYMTEDAEGSVPNSTMAWGPQPYKGRVFATDMYSGLWVVELEEPPSDRVP